MLETITAEARPASLPARLLGVRDRRGTTTIAVVSVGLALLIVGMKTAFSGA